MKAKVPLSMDAERAARQIIGAVRQRRAEVILTPTAQLVSRRRRARPLRAVSPSRDMN